MKCTTIAVDLSKSVFQISLADREHRIVDRRRLSRAQFSRFLATSEPVRLVMQACSTAHYWSRVAIQHGHRVKLLHAHYVRPYVRRNKTDAAEGVGVITATAMIGRVPDIQAFKRGRAFAGWLGITPREYSSGSTRRLGGIRKKGDRYLRTLLIHGARSALLAAARARTHDRPLTRLQRWALDTQQRIGHNKATVALANKMARIAWAVWTQQKTFNGNDALRIVV